MPTTTFTLILVIFSLLVSLRHKGQASLREALAKQFNVDSNMIVAGTGADDLLQLLVSVTQGRVFSALFSLDRESHHQF